MTAFTFREFEAYAAAVEDADLRMMLPRLKRPRWDITTFYLGEFHLQFGVEGSGNIAEGAAHLKGKVLFVPLAGGHRANGVPLHDHSVFAIDPGSEFTICAQEEHQWCSVLLPACAQDGESTQDRCCDSPPTGARVIELGAAKIAKFRGVLTRLRQAVEREPSVLTARAALKSMQEELNNVCQRTLSNHSAPANATGRPPLVRSELIRTVRDLMQRRCNESLTIEDLTTATDVSERTLRTIFLEYFGVPPQRFLLIHRLHQVRSVLRQTAPDETTVTAVAAQFGFWHFGRFAGAYGKLFGEPPSATLNNNDCASERLSCF